MEEIKRGVCWSVLVLGYLAFVFSLCIGCCTIRGILTRAEYPFAEAAPRCVAEHIEDGSNVMHELGDLAVNGIAPLFTKGGWYLALEPFRVACNNIETTVLAFSSNNYSSWMVCRSVFEGQAF